jgi:hypothetical protein
MGERTLGWPRPPGRTWCASLPETSGEARVEPWRHWRSGRVAGGDGSTASGRQRREEDRRAWGDAEEWGTIVAGMQKKAEEMKKTPITDEEAKQVLEYILATFAK